MTHSLDDEDDWTDDSEPDDDEVDGPGEDDGATIPCPYCHRPIHDESERCPHCGEYISAEDAPRAPKPWWLLVGAAAALHAVYHMIAH